MVVMVSYYSKCYVSSWKQGRPFFGLFGTALRRQERAAREESGQEEFRLECLHYRSMLLIPYFFHLHQNCLIATERIGFTIQQAGHSIEASSRNCPRPTHLEDHAYFEQVRAENLTQSAIIHFHSKSQPTSLRKGGKKHGDIGLW